jgi:hypothetical protein
MFAEQMPTDQSDNHSRPLASPMISFHVPSGLASRHFYGFGVNGNGLPGIMFSCVFKVGDK